VAEEQCPGCGRKVEEGELYDCPKCGRAGCAFCMPDGRGKECPQCEAGVDGLTPLQTEG